MKEHQSAGNLGQLLQNKGGDTHTQKSPESVLRKVGKKENLPGNSPGQLYCNDSHARPAAALTSPRRAIVCDH